ncbi:unnamed protein product, partial [Mesorhabditis spiculigera]
MWITFILASFLCIVVVLAAIVICTERPIFMQIYAVIYIIDVTVSLVGSIVFVVLLVLANFEIEKDIQKMAAHDQEVFRYAKNSAYITWSCSLGFVLLSIFWKATLVRSYYNYIRDRQLSLEHYGPPRAVVVGPTGFIVFTVFDVIGALYYTFMLINDHSLLTIIQVLIIWMMAILAIVIISTEKPAFIQTYIIIYLGQCVVSIVGLIVAIILASVASSLMDEAIKQMGGKDQRSQATLQAAKSAAYMVIAVTLVLIIVSIVWKGTLLRSYYRYIRDRQLSIEHFGAAPVSSA